jgi:hypothetical protein
MVTKSIVQANPHLGMTRKTEIKLESWILMARIMKTWMLTRLLVLTEKDALEVERHRDL